MYFKHIHKKSKRSFIIDYVSKSCNGEIVLICTHVYFLVIVDLKLIISFVSGKCDR